MQTRVSTYGQLLRYGITGSLSNAGLYVIYLLLTAAGAGPKTAMSGVFGLGVVTTFMFNRSWTFSHSGAPTVAFMRYATVYGGMYALNMATLYLLVDRAGLPHQIVVLVLVLVSAALIFILQKFWVFRDLTASSALPTRQESV